MDCYLESVEKMLQVLAADEEGLTEEQARERLGENGRNEMAAEKKKSLLRRWAVQLLNPMMLVLLAAVVVSAVVSWIVAAFGGGLMHDYAAAGAILLAVVLNSGLGVFQESKAEKALEALREMNAHTARVRRGGTVAEIPAGELVVGDIVLLEAGDVIPADMRLIQSAGLMVEEAALTGESVSVDKQVEALSGGETGKVSLGDRRNMVYMGSGVTGGRGEGVVTATGMATEMGKIAGMLQNAKKRETPLQKRLTQLSKVVCVLAASVCVVMVVMRLATMGPINVVVIRDSLMLAVSLAVAAIPEGLAAVVTVVLSMGVSNLAKRKIVVRRLAAAETLGCVQVLCLNKTGTLTQNTMMVAESFSDDIKRLAPAMALCCDDQLLRAGEVAGDPAEKAMAAFALQEGFAKNNLKREYPRVAEISFDSVRKMISTLHRKPEEQGLVQYTKGAPDEVLGVCTHVLAEGRVLPLTPERAKEISDKNREYADKAMRVLACAYKDWEEMPADRDPAQWEAGLTFIGLEALIHPVRPEAKAAVEACRDSGIKVVMMTGGCREAAATAAKELGMITASEQVITGQELDGLNDEALEKRMEDTVVYARVQPEHKVRMVNMWKQKGYVTAMIGGGVNDAPAFKSGDIGVGMGITGADVTRKAADMVLAKDHLIGIVCAVEEGRRIYDNIKKGIQLLLFSSLSEVLAIFAAAMIGFLLFKPVHLLFMNLIAGGLPAMVLGRESARPDLMKEAPRGEREGIFAGRWGIDVVYQGVLAALLTLVAYFIVGGWYGAEAAGSAAFVTLSMCQIFHAYNMRSQTQSVFTLKKANKMLLGAMGLSSLLTLTVIYEPGLARAFSLQVLEIGALAVSLGLAFLIIPLVEGGKALKRRVV